MSNVANRVCQARRRHTFTVEENINSSRRYNVIVVKHLGTYILLYLKFEICIDEKKKKKKKKKGGGGGGRKMCKKLIIKKIKMVGGGGGGRRNFTDFHFMQTYFHILHFVQA